MRTAVFGAVAAIAVTASVGVFAQMNYAGTPLYGTQNLSSGFTPDPINVAVVAGGSDNALTMNLGPGCTGFVAASQPDVRVNYTSGHFPLRFYVTADADTTLLVNAPDGSWHCNDDFNGLNPQVSFASPMSGQYDIWIGTYNAGSTQSATFSISEL